MTDILVIANSIPFRVTIFAITLLSFGLYLKLNNKKFGVDVLMTDLDRLIPFVPAFSIPYVLYLPFLLWLVTYGILFSPYYAEIAASILATQLAAAAVFRFHGTKVLRPRVKGKDVFSRLTAFIYKHDGADCAFPSLHVANAIVCASWTAVLYPSLGPAAAVLAAAIIASTVLLKQHVVIDVAGGVMVGVLCLRLVQ